MNRTANNLENTKLATLFIVFWCTEYRGLPSFCRQAQVEKRRQPTGEEGTYVLLTVNLTSIPNCKILHEFVAVVGLAIRPEARPCADVAKVVPEAPVGDLYKVGLVPAKGEDERQ